MRREKRKQKMNNSNTTVFITGGVLLIAIATFIITFIIYSNKLDNDLYALDTDYLSKYNYITNTTQENITSASSSIGKKVEESKENLNVINNDADNKINAMTSKKDNNDTDSKKDAGKTANKSEEKEPAFIKPIEGNILKEYAKESLIYSETLKEWTTHLGIDIKAERASIVKSAAEGTVKYIKNDPRYGLTIIIEHACGFETRYANMLTTEFVSEGEKVKVGQTIGTVGESSMYEIVDESHLHFEMLKNNENIDPTKYIKF